MLLQPLHISLPQRNPISGGAWRPCWILGRHILAKGFGRAPAEYKSIATEGRSVGLLDAEESHILEQMAGYRNRMVHFYHEVTPQELYRICTTRLGDIERIVEGFKRWVREHPERIDERL